MSYMRYTMQTPAFMDFLKYVCTLRGVSSKTQCISTLLCMFVFSTLNAFLFDSLIDLL